MTQTVAFGLIPSVHGGRGLCIANGTVADVVTAGSFAVQSTTGGSKALRNVLAPIITVRDVVFGSQVTAEATGSSNGYITVTLWNGTPTVPANAGTVVLNFLAIGGGGSI